MSTTVTAAQIAAFVNQINEPIFAYARSMMVVSPTVNTKTDRVGLAPRVFYQHPSATMQTLGQTDDIAGQDFTPDELATITPTEVGGAFLLQDERLRTSWDDEARAASLELGNSMAQKIESDLIGLFPSLTGGNVGAAGSVIAWKDFNNMRTLLERAKVPAPYVFICSPEHWNQLSIAASVASVAQTNASDDLKSRTNGQWYVGTHLGVQIYVSAYIDRDSGNDAYCAMYNPLAITLDIRTRPSIRPQRDESRRATELNMVGTYGKGVSRPAFGVYGLFDSIDPT